MNSFELLGYFSCMFSMRIEKEAGIILFNFYSSMLSALLAIIEILTAAEEYNACNKQFLLFVIFRFYFIE